MGRDIAVISKMTGLDGVLANPHLEEMLTGLFSEGATGDRSALVAVSPLQWDDEVDTYVADFLRDKLPPTEVEAFKAACSSFWEKARSVAANEDLVFLYGYW